MKIPKITPAHLTPLFVLIAGVYLYFTDGLTGATPPILGIIGVLSLIPLLMEKPYITLDEAEALALEEAEKRRMELRWTPSGDIINRGGKLQNFDNGDSVQPWRYVVGLKMLSSPERDFVCYMSTHGSVLAFDESEAGFKIEDIEDVIHGHIKGPEHLDKVPDRSD